MLSPSLSISTKLSQYFGPDVTYTLEIPKLYREAIHALVRWGSPLPPAEQVLRVPAASIVQGKESTKHSQMEVCRT